MDPAIVEAQKKAAHLLWVELTTRITTHRLPYRSGDEEAAVKSVRELFGKTRDLMSANPGATDFLALTEQLLNDVLRPYTARWHKWLTTDATERDAEGKPVLKFRDEWVRKQFRRELRALQPHLVGFALAFGAMKDGQALAPWWTAEDKTKEQMAALRKLCYEPMQAVLGKSLPAGIVADQVRFKGMTLEQQADLVERINQAEHGELRGRHGRASEGAVLDARALAFSGGGIRSATFGLGIAQVLARRGLFAQFDYLSTVSGGGYLGSFLSATLGTGECTAADEKTETAARLNAVLETPLAGPTALPPSHKPHETTPVRHLRNYSRYLTEGGFQRQFIGVSMVLAGVLFNLLIFLLLPLGLALLTNALDAAGVFHMRNWATNPDHWLPVEGGWSTVVLASLAVTALAGLAYPRIKSNAERVSPPDGQPRLLKLWEKVFLSAAIASVVLVGLSLLPLGFRLYDFILSGGFWPCLPDLKAKGEGLVAVFGGSLTVVLTAVAAKLKSKGTFAGWLRKLAILSGPAFALFVYFSVGHRLFIATGSAQWPWESVFFATLAILIWASCFVDVNTYSPHGYYRDRLSDCYVRAMRRVPVSETAPEGIVMEPVDRLPLSKLNERAAAPYHLINTTLNLPTSKEREVRGRNADLFLFSKHYCGSSLTGYHPTQELEAADKHLNLATAMAISGAAASSNMGRLTDNALRMVMTLGNVRLGYWLRNPNLGVAVTKTMSGPSSSYLLREMFALKLDETQPYLNLSDGGHHENLAAYELLRRRCKFIVAIDGGCESDMQCTDLIRLERYAAIDLGIKLHYDLSDLFRQTNGHSRAYGVLVKVDYQPPKTESARRARQPEDADWGWMLYLKLATVGYGPGYVLDYQRTHPAFPHESTGDQIYDEAQFEAYRALGEAAAESFFMPEITEAADTRTVAGWFAALAMTLLPDNDEALIKAGGKVPLRVASNPPTPPPPKPAP